MANDLKKSEMQQIINHGASLAMQTRSVELLICPSFFCIHFWIYFEQNRNYKVVNPNSFAGTANRFVGIHFCRASLCLRAAEKPEKIIWMLYNNGTKPFNSNNGIVMTISVHTPITKEDGKKRKQRKRKMRHHQQTTTTSKQKTHDGFFERESKKLTECINEEPRIVSCTPSHAKLNFCFLYKI